MDTVYITPTELRRIADMCETLDPIWDALTSGPVDGVSADLAPDDVIGFNVYDSNGEKLGRISFGDEKGVFYPNTDKD